MLHTSLLVVLSLCYYHSAAAENARKPCDFAQFIACGMQYLRELSFGLPYNAEEYATQVEALYKNKRMQGLELHRKAFTNLLACVGGLPITDLCISELKTTVSPHDALRYDIIYEEEKIAFLEEYQEVKSNFYCLYDAMPKFRIVQNYCIQQFTYNVTRNPTHACEFTQPTAECITQAMDGYCWKMSQIACRYVQVSLGKRFPKCPPVNC